jgi:hypothetical protein
MQKFNVLHVWKLQCLIAWFERMKWLLWKITGKKVTSGNLEHIYAFLYEVSLLIEKHWQAAVMYSTLSATIIASRAKEGQDRDQDWIHTQETEGHNRLWCRWGLYSILWERLKGCFGLVCFCLFVCFFGAGDLAQYLKDVLHLSYIPIPEGFF